MPPTQEQMIVNDPKKIVSEIRGVIGDREPLARALTMGRRHFHIRGLDGDPNHSAVAWVYHAHEGTLNKIAGLFLREDHDYSTYELLGIARNLFENLIWLRLFGRDSQYGLVFYNELLDQQGTNVEQQIKKFGDEATLFDHYDRLDRSDFDLVLAQAKGKTPEQVEVVMSGHWARIAKLDDEVRRSFAVYGAAAKLNTYSYQAQLIRTKVLPEYQNTLTEINAAISAFAAVKNALLTSDKLVVTKKWNWKDRAKEVDMGTQYDFLYGYTSKLMHSTPLNIITDKELSESEAILMLEYAFVAISDIMDSIESFSAPGQINVAAFEIDE